jgi:7-alpha-hydroxysteroid dehydrogenase
MSVLDAFSLAGPVALVTGGGAILNISSMAAENENARMAAYASSKAAESHLTPEIEHQAHAAQAPR